MLLLMCQVMHLQLIFGHLVPCVRIWVSPYISLILILLDGHVKELLVNHTGDNIAEHPKL